jgi:hypothetical protein
VNKEHQKELHRKRGKAVQMHVQRIQERHMGMYIDVQTAHVNTNKNRTDVVTQHAHTHRSTCNTLTRCVVQREIGGSGRSRGCWRVPKNREREAIVRTVTDWRKSSGMRRAAAAFAIAAPIRIRMRENEEPTCAAKG